MPTDPLTELRRAVEAAEANKDARYWDSTMSRELLVAAKALLAAPVPVEVETIWPPNGGGPIEVSELPGGRWCAKRIAAMAWGESKDEAVAEVVAAQAKGGNHGAV